MNPAPAGQLTLAGPGPGGLDCLTRRAERAIREAAVVAGYHLYLELVIPLIEDQEIIEFPMGPRSSAAGRWSAVPGTVSASPR